MQAENAAFEEYQYRISQLFATYDYIVNIAEDILIGGKNITHDDKNLGKCFEKCLFNKPEVPLYKFKTSADGIKPMDNKINTILNFRIQLVQRISGAFLG